MADCEQPDTESDCDQELRKIFNSCDSVGLGLLAPGDFEVLCNKLMIGDHLCNLLFQELFPDSDIPKPLSYERFRETLVMLLEHDEKITKNDPTDIEIEDTDLQNNIEPQDIPHPIKQEAESETNLNENRIVDDDMCNDDVETLNSPQRQPHFKKRYGRTSKPDADLLENRYGEAMSENPPVLGELPVSTASNTDCLNDENVPNVPWKYDENGNEKENSVIAMKEEEFTGNGDEENWKNPDSEWMTTMNTTPEKIEPTSRDSPMLAVKTKLETAWFRVVGNPATDGIDEAKLGNLCVELGLNNLLQPADIADLFEALDADCDGLVMFDEFSDLMSTYIGSQPHDEQTERNISYTNDLSDVSGVYQLECTFDQQNEQIDDCKRDTDARSTLMHSSLLRGESPDNHQLCLVTHNPDDQVRSIDHNSPVQVSDEPSSPSPSPSGRLSLDNDTSQLCPPVIPVEPRQLAASSRGRRRQRSSTVAVSNPAGIRHQRRKTNRSIPLPHYHPTSIRKREELPLSYLAEENGRYVSRDALCEHWEADGIENSSEVFDALQLSSSEQSISIEALSEVLETEFDQNIIERAALILYKRGIMHYRGLNHHGEAERTKLVNKINLLTSQLQEQEERLEKAESNFALLLRENEARYKTEIRALTNEITETQTRLKEFKDSSLEDRQTEIELLNQKFEEASRTCEEMRIESERLARLLQETEARLTEAEEDKIAMLDDIDVTRSELAISNELLVTQRARNSQIHELWRLNEMEFQSMQDRHDELLARLHNTGRRRTSSGILKSSPRWGLESPVLSTSDSSTYTTASEELQRFSPGSSIAPSGDVLMTHSPGKGPLTSSPDNGARLPSDSFSNSKRISLSNEFAFLSPSSTRPRPRLNQTYSTVNSAGGSQSLNGSSVTQL